ncbi:glycoside hydrolase family 26 protein [Streptomyces parvulus]|uniref:glycosyl hydrolase n=1 Tax=Streptomyces parvulus TaxID=146923 RepID=UPI00210C7C77|nr:glycosyl hydrolase [Streptomyces parvulus]MCQ4196474.1 glycoside hydrolase family 26 protein [Streptomyces parvulus]
MRFARPARRTTADSTTGQHRPPKPSGPTGHPGHLKRRRRLLITSVAATCAVLVAVLALRDASGPADPAADPRCRPTALLEPPCGAWFGAFVPHDKSDLAAKVRGYEEKVGRRLDIVYTYHDMSAVTETRLEGQLLTPQEQRVGEDRMLLLSWESKWWGGTKGQQPTWKEIAAGDLDESVIDVQARRVKEYGQRTGRKVFLSFDLEMDTRTPDNGTPADYVRAYRHLHDRFRELGVDNVVWTWIITGYLNHGDLFERMYPGDEYVDWIGYNQYNYYLCHKTGWLSFAQTQYATHDWIRAHISDDKPLMLSEFGSAADPERPGRQADWYDGVPRVLKDLEGVKAALQWNYRDPGPHCDLAVADDRAWASLREVAADPHLNQPRE